MSLVEMDPHDATQLVSDNGEVMHVVSDSDWQTIRDAAALLKGRLRGHVDPLFLLRLNAVTETVLTLDRGEVL